MNYSEPLDNDPTMDETPSVYDPAPFDAPLDNDPTMTEDVMQSSPEPDNNNDDGFSTAASSAVAAATATAAAAGTYMWAALDATGIVPSTEGDQNPSGEPKQDRIEAFDPFAMSDDEEPPEALMEDASDSDDEPATSRGAPGAVAVAGYDPSYDQNLKGDTDSDTGDESDAKGKDSDSETGGVLVAAVPDREAEDKRERRMLIGAVFLVFFLAIFAGAYAGAKVEEERVERAKSTEYEAIPTIPKCFPGSNPTRETAFMQVSLDGMGRQASSTELQQVQDAVTGVYNGVTGGCSDVYERIMESATVVNQNLIADSKGKSHLSIDLTTSLRCNGCTAEHEYLFSPWNTYTGKASSSAKGKGSGKGTTTTAGGERKLRRGNRHSRGVRGHRDLQSVAPIPINTIGTPPGTITGKGKGGKGKGKHNAHAQMFIDSLDATLQTSNLPLKKVKAAYIYEQTAIWKGEKLKLKPTKKDKKKHGKGKGTSDKISAGRRQRR